MAAPRRRWILPAVVLLVLGIVSLFVFQAPRSALARSALGVFFRLKGFELAQGDLQLGGGRLSVRNFVVNEHSGAPFVALQNLDVAYQLHGLSLTVTHIDCTRPVLTLRKEEDGSFNFSRLIGGNAVSTPNAHNATAKAGAPLHLDLRVRNGFVSFENPYAPARPGRHFSIDRIDLDAVLDQGHSSRGWLGAFLNAGQTVRPISATFFENDVKHMAELRARATGIAFAPILDLLIASPAFTVEQGVGDVALHAYAIGWPSGTVPQWHVSAAGRIYDGRIRVVPLVAPVRDLNTPFALYDASLVFPRITGTTVGVPVNAYGGILLQPSVGLRLSISASGRLERIRNLLAVLKPLPLHGEVQLVARVAGAPTNPRVAVEFTTSRGMSYARLRVSSLSGSLVYNDKHVTVPAASAVYAGFKVAGNGDLDLNPVGPPVGNFVVSLRGPTAAIPWVANLEDAGTLSARATLLGPITKLQGSGFIQLVGAQTIRTSFTGGLDDFTFGPLIASDRHGGSLWLAANVDRLHDYATDAHLVAHHFHLRFNGRHTRLPGIFDIPYGLPAGSALLDGVVSLSGAIAAPTFGVNLQADHLAFANSSYGRLVIHASGEAGSAHITQVAIDGPALKLRAWGDVARSPQTGVLRGSARGWTVSQLDSLARFAPVAGRAQAAFAAQFGNHDLVGSARLVKSDARIDGVPLQAADLLFGVHGKQVRIYAASASLAGGKMIAAGVLPSSSRGSHRLTVAVDNIDLAELRALGLPLAQGQLTAFANIAGTQSRPTAAISGALSGASFAGHALDAAAQLALRGSSISTNGSRLFIDNSTAIDLAGSINGLTAGASLDPGLSLSARVRDADLRALAPVQAAGMPLLTGTADGDVAIGGTLAAPSISGQVRSDVGSVHGVTYQSLNAAISGGLGGISVSGGHVTVGSSSLDVAGALSPQAMRVSFASPHLDLSDFNDYFDGADVLQGVGQGRLSMASSTAASNASGYIALHDTVLAHLPLGTIRTDLATRRGSIFAVVHQHSPLAATTIQGSVAFPRHIGVLPDFRRIQFDARGSARNIDLSLLTPLLPSVTPSLRGSLSVVGSARGSLSQLASNAQFELLNGYVGKDRIDEFRGRLLSDARGFSVPDLRASVNGATLTARGSYTRERRIAGRAVFSAHDVARLARLARLQSPISGPMTVTLDAAGSLQQPLLHAVLTAPPGSLYGVGYDGLSADAQYTPGLVEVRNASAQLSHRQGSFVLSGTLPVPYGPQPRQRNHLRRPMALSFSANAVNLAAFDPVLQQQGSLQGRFDANARASGSYARPQLAGSATVRSAAIYSKVETVPVTALNADVTFSNDAISMPSLHAKLGRGTIEASARARLIPPRRSDQAAGIAYRMRLAASHANLNVPRFFSGVIDANLNLRSNRAKPILAGNIDLSNTQVPFSGILALASGSSTGVPPQAGPIPGVPPLRPGHSISYAGSIYGDQPHLVQPTSAPIPVKRRLRQSAPIALDITANAVKNVAVTGLVDASGEGSVHIGGSANAPSLSGSLTAIRGEVGAFDTIFHLLRGTVSFDPTDGLLPTIDAQAVAERPEAEITVTVAGRIDQMRTQLESDPPMSESAILADILHINQIDNALTGGQNGSQPSSVSNPGGAVENFAGAALTGKLLSAINYGLEQSLNISEVNFAFDARGQPNLELRKQYGKNLYALFRTSFQTPPQQSVGVAYALRDALEMEFVQKQNTAGQNLSDLTQTTTFTVNLKFR